MIGAVGLAGYAADDWLAAASLATLLAGYKLLATHDHLYVLPLAYPFPWNQTSLGVFYGGITGRQLDALALVEYREMVLIGLGCCLALAIGIRLGMSLVREPDP